MEDNSVQDASPLRLKSNSKEDQSDRPTTFDDFLRTWSQEFENQGEFELGPKDLLRDIVKTRDVPNEPGVYLVYGLTSKGERLLYIGKGGTLNNDGKFKEQKIRGRLMNVQDNQRRQAFFRHLMKSGGFGALRIRYLVTYGGRLRIVPAVAEAQLLQAYFAEHGTLPPLNKWL